MADNFEIKFKLDDGGLNKTLKDITSAIKKFDKAVNKLRKEQKNLVSQQKKAVSSSKQKASSDKKLIELAKQQQIQMQTQADLERLAAAQKKKKIKLQEQERKATIMAKDARRANILQIKREEQETRKLFLALKKDIQERSKHTVGVKLNTKALKQNAFSIRMVGKGMIDITNQGRLVQNSFATIRSKLLLTSFAFGLVTAAVGRNIKAFAEQQESVLRLGLQFGSSAANELAEFASAQQKITRFGDEVINSVMSQFGAYGANVEQTKLLTTATLDLAEGQGMDLNSAALLVAKSFGSTTNALSRYGITIDSSSSKQEKINQIITQSQKKYGGLAKLLGGMAGSEITQLSMAFGDLRERFGDVLQEGLEPLIKGMTKFVESFNTTHIRIMIEAVVSLGASFIFLRTVAIGSAMITAITTASKTLARFSAIQLATKGVTTGLTTSLVVFKRTLIGVTGGFGALLAITATVGVALFEMTGLFKSTAEEEENASSELDKYAESMKNFKTDEGMQELEKFFKKLVEGNQLLKIANASFTTDIAEDLSNIFGKIDKSALLNDANNLIAIIANVNQQILDDSQKNGQARRENDKKIRQLQTITRNKGYTDEQEELKQNLLAQRAILTQERDRLFGVRKQLMLQLAGINQTFVQGFAGTEFKDKFIELTGVTSDFFEKFVANSGIQDSIQSGLISTNSELVAVMNQVVSKDANFLKLSEEKRLAIIAEIVEKERLNKKNKEVSNNAIKFAEMEASAKAKLIGGTLKATAALLTSQGKNAKEGARLQQLAAIADTYAAATKTVLNPLQMAQVIIAGLANVAQIEAALNQMGGGGSGGGGGGSVYGSFEQGGYVGGNRHSQGGTIIEAERGEFVMSRNAVESIGLETLNQMNQSGGGGSINVSVTGNVLTQDFVEGELAESIKEAVRRGSDFGIG